MPARSPAFSLWRNVATAAVLVGLSAVAWMASSLPDEPLAWWAAAGAGLAIAAPLVLWWVALSRVQNDAMQGARSDAGRIDSLERENRRLVEELATHARAERLLHESEERFRLMVDGVVDYAIVVLDPLGNVASWNAGATRITGHRSDESIGQHCSLFYTRSDVERGRPRADLDAASASGRFEDEGLRLRRDGSTFWASEVTTPIRDAGGKLVGFSRVTRDLSERRSAEKLLQESEQRFRMMVDSVVDYAIYMLDPEGRVASWNPGAARIYGFLAEEVTGQHVSRFYPRADVEQHKHDHELAQAAVTGRFESEGWRVRKDGSTFWANVIITAVRDAGGRPIGFSKVTRDLTDRRRVELELLAAKAAAERASTAKSEFLATMSHELRTPLNSLLILARLLSDNQAGNLTPKQIEYAKTIHSSGLDLLALINDILDLARIESGVQAPLNIVVEAIPRLALELERMFREVAESRKLRFEIVVDPGLPPGLRTDPQRLLQVVKNLLSNAFKFTREGGVTVRFAPARSGWSRGHQKLESAHAVVAISVTDTGIGIAADKHETVFEPFQQADGSTSREFGGTGLGLSISRALARLLGGELVLSSRVGEGSTFTLYLPLVADVSGAESKAIPAR